MAKQYCEITIKATFGSEYQKKKNMETLDALISSWKHHMLHMSICKHKDNRVDVLINGNKKDGEKVLNKYYIEPHRVEEMYGIKVKHPVTVTITSND